MPDQWETYQCQDRSKDRRLLLEDYDFDANLTESLVDSLSSSLLITRD